jgi:hypothetical protein
MSKSDISGRFPRLMQAATLLHETRCFFLILALVATAGYILAFVHQGLDLLRTVTDVNRDHTSGYSLQVFWLCFSVLALGFQGWFWARVVAENRSHSPRGWASRAYLMWVPRLLGLTPFGFLFIALSKVQTPAAWTAWILAALGVAAIVFLWTRKSAVRRLKTASENLAHEGREKAAKAIDGSLRNFKQFLFWAGIMLALAAMIVVIYDPVTLPVFFGPAAVVLTACALLIPVLTSLSLLGSAFHIRMTELLFIVILVTSLWVDNHEVRRSTSHPAVQTQAINGRPSLEAAYQRWRSQFPPGDGQPIPMIFIASEGGASRAGYWTGAVMSRLETATAGSFSKHIFAISSISGGSLGVGGFLSSLHDGRTRTAIAAGQGNLALAVSDFVGRDYLSPALAGGLFPDFLQRFFPISIFPDRAAALEKGWEAGWRSRCSVVPCDDPQRMERDFLDLWKGEASENWLPAWLIGGALEEDGRPILTSSIRFGEAVDAWDFHDVAQRDVRLSTAILNGARFPIVSPSGTIKHPVLPHKMETVHIVDGGYFDAAGVETIRGLARSILAPGGPADADRIVPIYLLLSNDGVNPPFSVSEKANLPSSTPVACRGQIVKAGCPNPAGLATVIPDLLGPVQGLFRARGAHGEKLKTLLYLDPPRRADSEPIILTIDLCSLDVPMNWSLSENAKRIVNQLLDERASRVPGSCEEKNDRDFDALVSLFEISKG